MPELTCFSVILIAWCLLNNIYQTDHYAGMICTKRQWTNISSPWDQNLPDLFLFDVIWDLMALKREPDKAFIKENVTVLVNELLFFLCPVCICQKSHAGKVLDRNRSSNCIFWQWMSVIYITQLTIRIISVLNTNFNKR